MSNAEDHRGDSGPGPTPRSWMALVPPEMQRTTVQSMLRAADVNGAPNGSGVGLSSEP